MDLKGHLVDVGWNGEILRLRATNADGRALANTSSEDGRLELAVEQIAEVWFRDAPRGVGGVLLVTGTDGEAHRLHYRRATREAFHELYVELSAAIVLCRSEQSVIDLTEATVDPSVASDLPVLVDRDPATQPVG